MVKTGRTYHGSCIEGNIMRTMAKTVKMNQTILYGMRKIGLQYCAWYGLSRWMSEDCLYFFKFGQRRLLGGSLQQKEVNDINYCKPI